MMNFGGTIQINSRVLIFLILLTITIFIFYTLNIDSSYIHQISSLNKINAGELLCAAIAAAEAGGIEVKNVRMNSDAQLNEKLKGKTKEGVKDVLTDGDLRSHTVMFNALTTHFPEVKVGISECYSHLINLL